MHWFKNCLVALTLASGALATRDQEFLEILEARLGGLRTSSSSTESNNVLLDQATTKNSSPYLNSRSKKFVVNGKKIPEVDFDVGESYAGLLPVSNKKDETRQLYFWFFPSQSKEKAASDEIVVWLNGGPGCSSLSGLITENGPFLWSAGTLAPIKNPYSWNRLTNMVWIEQPVGTGFSQGKPNISDELALAEQFKGFWKNFVDTFKLDNRKVYLTGESYAGMYVPYIANSFLKAKDTKYFNLKGIAINDPVIGDGLVQQVLPLVPFASYWSNLLGLDKDSVSHLQQLADESGYTNYTNKYFRFPPPPQPWDATPKYNRAVDQALNEATSKSNPCFNVYHITDTCPVIYSQLGIVNQGDYSPPGASVYFQRKDVQKAINAPLIGEEWLQCGGPVFVGGDASPGPALDGTLENIIAKTKNAIIGSGALDALLPTNGTLFALQNMTWGGKQGFSAFPSTKFIVPDHDVGKYMGYAGGTGDLGVWRKERGLTFYDIQLAGHEVPGYAPSAGYRVLQALLGRVKDFSSTDPLF